MNDHDQINDLLPFYVSGQLDDDQRRKVAAHLQTCRLCQDDLALWQAVSGQVAASDRAVPAPSNLPERALRQVRLTPRRPGLLRRAWMLLCSQVPLVRREIWPASAIILAIGCILALVVKDSGVIRALAPLTAAACIVVLFGPENDPAFELTLATPTSAALVLLARMALVFGYNFLLALTASLVMLPFLQTGTLQDLVLGWLGPMAFLSSVALLLSLVIGPGSAVAVAYLAWLGQFAPTRLTSGQGLPLFQEIASALAVYQNFWQQTGVLLALALLLLAPIFWLAGRNERGLMQQLS
jgi:hypothetical protein